MVQFKFVVTNTTTGPTATDLKLYNVKVTDDVFDLNGGAAGGAWNVGTLAAGASQTMYLGPMEPDMGQHVNTATATGDYVCGSHTFTYTDTDKAHYRAIYHTKTPGYWKNHTEVWSGTECPRYDGGFYTPETLLLDVFTIPAGGAYDTGGKRHQAAFTGDHLLDALYFRGGSTLNGKAQTLFRAATAAILNATHGTTYPKTSYPYTDEEIVGIVNQALADALDPDGVDIEGAGHFTGGAVLTYWAGVFDGINNANDF